MPPTIEEILRAIADLSLRSALLYLVGHKIHDFSRAGYERIKKAIQDKQNEGKYAFVPNKKEAIKLLELKDEPHYRGMLLLIPNYQYIDLIRTGLLINRYQKMKNPKSGARIRDIKNHISNRPNGAYLLKIVRFPTTPFFSVIVNYLYELKIQGYSDSFLVEAFNESVEAWESSSKFVESFDKTVDVIKFIKEQINKNKRVFFILGMKTAGKKVQTAIEELKDFLREKGYAKKITISEPKKVEVMVYTKT